MPFPRTLAFTLAAALAAPLASPVRAQTGSTTVAAQTGIYQTMGNETSSSNPGIGTAPVAIALAAGTNRVLTISNMLGSITCYAPNAPSQLVSADGRRTDGGTCDDVGAYSGTAAVNHLSGFATTQPTFIPLTAVFTGAALPATAPSYLTFGPGGNYDFTAASIAPQIGQVFFVGDGLTAMNNLGSSAGSQQRFLVPDGATQLFFGFIDGPDGYSYLTDNGGSLTFTYTVTAAPSTSAPEPGVPLLLGAGLLGLVPALRRRG